MMPIVFTINKSLIIELYPGKRNESIKKEKSPIPWFTCVVGFKVYFENENLMLQFLNLTLPFFNYLRHIERFNVIDEQVLY